jgi:hypothetical protein
MNAIWTWTLVNNINDQLDATITILLIFESAKQVLGKWLPEACWADSKINKIVIVASSWSFILFAYIDDTRSNTNQMNVSGMIVIVENQSVGRKPSPSAIFSSTNPTCNGLSLNLGLHGEMLSHVIAVVTCHLFVYIYHAKIPLQETSRNHW